MDPLAELKEIYFQECDELLLSLESCLEAMAGGAHEAEQVNAAFRAIHSIKGGAGAFGFPDLVAFAHSFEAALDRLRSGTLAVADAPIRLFMRASDALADILAAARNGGASPDFSDVLADIKVVASGGTLQTEASAAPRPVPVETKPAPLQAGPQTLDIAIRPQPDLFDRAIDPARLIGDIESFGFPLVIGDIDPPDTLEAFDPARCHLRFDIRLETEMPVARIKAVLGLYLADSEFTITAAAMPVEQAPEARPAGSPMPSVAEPGITETGKAQNRQPKTAGSLRVDLDRIDRMMNLVGEIVITQSMLISRTETTRGRHQRRAA